MPLTLHILPPAFTLPSIDAQCLAAIAYMRFALPYGAWVLMADAAAHNKTPPFLSDGSTSIEGFEAIVSHLRRISNGQVDLDASLTKQQRADSLALRAHMEQHLAPLLDLSLYVCSENYSEISRPAYAAGLVFPESWITPHAMHKRADEATAHLGVSTADLVLEPSPKTPQGVSEPSKAFDDPAASADSKTNPTLARQVSAHKRISALVESAVQPLSAFLKQSNAQYLFSDTPSTADCLLLALSSLALIPVVPVPFLSANIKQHCPSLDTYVHHGIEKAFGGKVTPQDALVKAPLTSDDDDDDPGFGTYENMDIGSGKVELPWRRPKPRSVGQVVGGLAARAVGSVQEAVVGA